jgi:hypothetical protein
MIKTLRDGVVRRVVSSIHRGKQLHLVQKKYRNVKEGKWQFFEYNCDNEEKYKLFEHEYQKNGTKFNYWVYHFV